MEISRRISIIKHNHLPLMRIKTNMITKKLYLKMFTIIKISNLKLLTTQKKAKVKLLHTDQQIF